MTEEKLLDLLTELRRRDPGETAETDTIPHPEGLTFARAWELAEYPSSITESERSHLRICLRCDHLVQCAQHEQNPESPEVTGDCSSGILARNGRTSRSVRPQTELQERQPAEQSPSERDGGPSVAPIRPVHGSSRVE